MPLEDEVKLEVPRDFTEPAIAPDGGIDEIELIPEVRTVTIYFDTADGRLQQAKTALRFRYRVGAEKFPGQHDPVKPEPGQEGIWATKTKGRLVESQGVTATERHELEVRSTFAELPDAAMESLGIEVNRAELRVIAAMDARRSSRRIVADTVEAMQIDDDLVHVIAGPAAGEVFREIEFELADARFAQLRSRLVESFIASGAKYSSAGSKLERALGLGR
ncbi:MAG: CYTH domain-containing protein [Actinomycetota bacterium]|jgi:inorganic triphosphatase YgiF|nr:CYTH domain-containing protein [Actinomycetota bacterium]